MLNSKHKIEISLTDLSSALPQDTGCLMSHKIVSKILAL